MSWDHVTSAAKAASAVVMLIIWYYAFLFGIAKPIHEADQVPQMVTSAYQDWRSDHEQQELGNQ